MESLIMARGAWMTPPLEGLQLGQFLCRRGLLGKRQFSNL